jgi:hypothetical protein
MNTLNRSALGLIGTLAIAGTAYAQVPSSNDTSDANGNTGMGSDTLGGPAASNSGLGNTASGDRALQPNTTGHYNTASGYYALSLNTTGNDNRLGGSSALFQFEWEQ